MKYRFAGGLLAVAVCVGGLPAAEKVEGKFKSVDPAKGTLTLTVGGKDRQFTIRNDTEIQVVDIRSRVLEGTVKERLQAPVFEEARQKGFGVVVKTEQHDGKEVVKEVVVYTGRK